MIKNHIIVYKDGFFFGENETFAITSSKVGLGEYSTYDLKTQGRWKQMLIQ